VCDSNPTAPGSKLTIEADLRLLAAAAAVSATTMASGRVGS